MSAARTWEVARLELFRDLKRPLFWILMLVILLMTWGMSSGDMRISSGDSDVGGTKAWITSEFALAQWFSIVTVLVMSFFIAVATGMLPIQERDQRLPELLLSTPLTPGEYVLGKFVGVMGMFAVALTLQLLASAFFNHLLPNAAAAEFHGPFQIGNYVWPILLMVLPYVVFLGGVSLYVGERFQRPILVFVLPVVLVLGCMFFLFTWSPSWLSNELNVFLMLIEPSGFRWLSETWLQVDRGVDFYNQTPVTYDAAFLASRATFAAIGAVAVALAWRRFRRGLRGARVRSRDRSAALAATPRTMQPVISAPLAAIRMSTRTPSALRGFWTVLTGETRALLTQPGLYLFVPLIILQSIMVNQTRVGGFDEPLLWTPGTIAVGSMNTLSLLICLLLLFYTVESLDRERRTGLLSILSTTPLRTGSLLLGKTLANSVVAFAVLVGAVIGCAIVLALQAKVPIRIGPFALVWGLLLIPTFIFWTTLVACLQAMTRSRYTTYALALAFLAWTGYRQVQGDTTWVTNWNLWGAVLWTDFGSFELGRTALILNRAWVLSASLLLGWSTVRLWARRDRDVSQTWHRWHPKRLVRLAVPLLLLAALPATAAVLLNLEVDRGFQGEVSDKKAKDYWRKNVATWTDAKNPTVQFIDADVRLEPAESFLAVRGRYELRNHHDVPLRQIALSRGLHWREVTWTLGGEPFEPEDRAGLMVFTPERPLLPDQSIEIGFAFEGHYPDGATENGGGANEFILASGVVLTGFSASFLPRIGFASNVGVDKDNRADSKVYPDDFFEGVTESGFGAALRYHTRFRIDVPEAYTVNSVGTLRDERIENGRRIALWETDFPVVLANIVAGKWNVRRGEGTAIYHHPDHTYNLDEMIGALDAARKYYSEWFHPYPWAELKVSEFPALAGYAQGFPTNITFSEGIGFLTESDKDSSLAFMVTAHETAHQWWGNLVVPGVGPGANLLSEAMAHFSTLLLIEEVQGEAARIEFARRIEDRYGEGRVADSERSLYWIDGSRPGDNTCTYDKGGWVFWMLLNHLGRESMLSGLQQFIAHYLNDLDHPVLQDLTAFLKPFASDPAAYDEFVRQWFETVVVPEYRLSQVDKQPLAEGGWRVRMKIENVGTGTMPVDIAATRGDRFPDEEAAEAEGFRDSRVRRRLAPGEAQEIEISCDFDPERVVIDPDLKVLQLRRKFATRDL